MILPTAALTALLAAALAPAPAPAAPLDPSFLDQWGVLVACGGGLYFESNGNIYGLASTGPFQAGDAVYVIGLGGPTGPQPCPQAREFFSRITVSNFDPIVETCPCPATASCSGAPSDAGCLNGVGLGAALEYDGMPSVTATSYRFDLIATGLPGGQAGLIFMGSAGAPATPLGDGLLCIGSGTGLGLHRFPLRVASNSGRLTEPDVVATSQGFAPGGRITVGTTWHFQAWYRDPAGPCGTGSNTSSGLQVTFLL